MSEIHTSDLGNNHKLKEIVSVLRKVDLKQRENLKSKKDWQNNQSFFIDQLFIFLFFD
jgi:hypothetical protein